MSRRDRNQGGLVYSTGQGRMCPQCCRTVAQCVCSRRPAQVVAGDGIVRLRLERKGRKGAGVTLVCGLPLGEPELKQLASELKKKCGVGGSVKDANIEIQGDQRLAVKAELEQRGWKVKLAGG